MEIHIVIPARFASTRLPGKPLADIAGEPMIVRVAAQAARSMANDVLVAVDDQRVAAAVVAAGWQAEMTREDHVSGSDRVMEVASRRGWSDDDIVINVQGDEPLVPPQVIDQLCEGMVAHPDVSMATLSEPISEIDEFLNPNVVKVVADDAGMAMTFSRSPIPYPRDTAGHEVPKGAARHVGIYGFRVSALRRFIQLGESSLESIEKLEQLRWLQASLPLLVIPAKESVPGGVDTPKISQSSGAVQRLSPSYRFAVTIRPYGYRRPNGWFIVEVGIFDNLLPSGGKFVSPAARILNHVDQRIAYLIWRTGHHWSVENAWGDGANTHALSRQISRDWQSHAGDAGLTGGVGCLTNLAVKGRDRCGIDDDAAFQRFAFRFVHLHDRRALAEHRESPNQIHLNNKIEFGNVESAFASNRTRGRADARAVYIDVDRAKVLGDLVYRVANGFVIRNIYLISAGIAKLVGSGLRQVFIQV